MVMRVFVAGGTGVVGRQLVPQLVARGHQVTATTTSAAKLGLLAQLGADGVVMDGLDAVSVGAQLLQQAQLGRARRRRRHVVTTGHELRHQPPPHDPGPACHEHPHDHHLPDSRVCL